MSKDPASASSKRAIGTGRLIAIIVVAVLALIFIVQNFVSVPVKVFGLEVDLPLWLVMVVMFILGMLLGGVARTGVRRLRGKSAKHPD